MKHCLKKSFWNQSSVFYLEFVSSVLSVFGLDGGGGSLITKSCLALVTPWTVARHASLSVGFTRQEYWNG